MLWENANARYELKIDEQTVAFVPKFLSRKVKKGPRGGKTHFPSTRNELAIATAWRLALEKNSVLIYCPERRSVNALAKQILRAHDCGFLDPLPVADQATLKRAVLLGQEWLGDHPVVRCLALGVAIHHAVLPKPFLRVLDALIRERNVNVVIASPTLARGLNISASCVIFQALARYDAAAKKPLQISSEEFGNVSGRAGRAYVDVDGQVLGMCFSYDDVLKWNALLKEREKLSLESGLIGIAARLFGQLSARIGAKAEDLEFIANTSDIWTTPVSSDDEAREWEETVAILDAALLSLLGETECEPEELAAQLDAVLGSSFLRRRLRRYTERIQGIVNGLLVGRARHIWANTSATDRRSYFFCGIGVQAGKDLDASGSTLGETLSAADKAFNEVDMPRTIELITEAADLLFEIRPFAPSVLPERWKEILSGWLSGVPVHELLAISNDAQAFIDEGIVYRLVWALESVRVRSLAHGEGLFDDKPSPLLAALETGATNLQEALLLQAGLSSRVAAKAALESCPSTFETVYGLREWLSSGAVTEAAKRPNWPTATSRAAWLEFLRSQVALKEAKWTASDGELDLHAAEGASVTADMPVFLWQREGETRIQVYAPDMTYLGESSKQFKAGFTPWACGTALDESSIRFRYVGPVGE